MPFPSQPVDGCRAAYVHAVAALGHLRSRQGNLSVGMNDIGPSLGAWNGQGRTLQNAHGCQGIICVPLERSSTLSQSGSAISAQRTANLNLRVGLGRQLTGDADPVTYDDKRYLQVYVHYVKLISVFLDSAVVRS